MTRYTVVWSKGAQDESMEIWMAAQDRRDVTAAIDAMDRQLAVDASLQGIEIREGLRALVVPPIKVLFSVREADRIVEIAKVRRA